jgi:RNA polymerase sigma-70 factor (ECF subfamily)
MQDEAELIRRASAGDLDAFEVLVNLKRDRVFRTAYQVVRNSEDARDIAQLVFVRLWRVIRRYRAERKFDTWLYRITVNLAIDYSRKQAQRGVEVPLERLDSAPVAKPSPDGTGGAASRGALVGPEEQAGRAELRRIYETVAGELTARQRLIFTLREVEGLTPREIGRALGVTSSTVRNTLFQVRGTLAELLRQRFPEYFPPTPKKTAGRREKDSGRPGPSGGPEDPGGEER